MVNRAIIDNVWGDAGKGRYVDLYAELADIIGRGTGGSNAGHTVVVGDLELKLHLIPSGIVHDQRGVINFLGNGVAIAPSILDEIRKLDEAKVSYNNFKIAFNAHVVLPQHIIVDRVKESSDGELKIGTTGRGMGPHFQDRSGRRGIRIYQLLNKDLLAEKLKTNLAYHLRNLSTYNPELVKTVIHQDALGNGMYWHPDNLIDFDAVVEAYYNFGQQIRRFIADTDSLAQKAYHDGKNILAEGAQGFVLGVDTIADPFVTSSDPTIRGLAKGIGLNTACFGEIYGVFTGLFMHRVGEGPFPTEIGGREAEDYCREMTREQEALYPNSDINSSDSIEQNRALRIKSGNYGTTTERARRIGWTDLPILKTAMRVNGPNLIGTKLDILDEVEQIRIAVAHRYRGPKFDLGYRMLNTGDTLREAVLDPRVLNNCEPIYENLPGWQTDITGIRDQQDLPTNILRALSFIEENTGGKIHAISVGPERDQVVYLN